MQIKVPPEFGRDIAIACECGALCGIPLHVVDEVAANKHGWIKCPKCNAILNNKVEKFVQECQAIQEARKAKFTKETGLDSFAEGLAFHFWCKIREPSSAKILLCPEYAENIDPVTGFLKDEFLAKEKLELEAREAERQGKLGIRHGPH